MMMRISQCSCLLGFGVLVASWGCESTETVAPGGLGGGAGLEASGGTASGGEAAQPACLAGQKLCAGVCIDIVSNVSNCGACGEACGAGAVCEGGQCVCQSGLSECNGTCVNLSGDGTSCGTCGNVCIDGQVCSNGLCQSTCGVSGQTQCGTSCVDLTTDAANCGACGGACAAGQLCVGAQCHCLADQSLCGAACSDVATDAMNCGACGAVCPAGQSCVGGSCLGGTGGNAATGGTGNGVGGTSIGGSQATGGNSAATGGAGAQTGGTAGGGGVTGSTGGDSTGGSASGGSATGGLGNGGSTTGGSATGGTSNSTGCEDGDYYVAVDGNDSNPGTMDQPFATLQRAIDAAEAGDLVYVRGGTYEIVQGATAFAGVYFSTSGASDTNRIRYFACPGEVPVFDFSRLNIQPDPNYTTGFVIEGAWLHLKGFEVCNVPMNTRSNTAVGLGGRAHDDIIEQFNIHHNFGSGMFINTTTGGHQIINCDSHDNYDPYSHQGDGENADGFGVHYQETGPSTVIRGCRAWWNSDDGYDFISQEVPVIIENSWAMGGGYINSGTGTAGNGNGFKIGSSKTGIRHVVRNCVAWGNRATGFYANHSAGGNDWFNNTSYDNGTQYNMLASSWDADGNRTDGVILSGALAHVMRNNIGYPEDNTNMQGVDSQFNTWDLGVRPSDSDFVSVSDEGCMGPRNPDGSLPVLDFMRLLDGSQMIDQGTDVGLPYNGSAPDLGAYEN